MVTNVGSKLKYDVVKYNSDGAVILDTLDGPLEATNKLKELVKEEKGVKIERITLGLYILIHPDLYNTIMFVYERLVREDSDA